MANPKHKLKREDLMAFLLGELEDAEQSRIESMFLADEDLRDELENAKSELFNEYKSGRLSGPRSGAFEKRYLPASIDADRKEFREMLAKNEAARTQEALEEANQEAREHAAQTARAAEPMAKPRDIAPAQGSVSAPRVTDQGPATGKKSSLVPILVASILVIAGAALAFFLVGGSESGTSSRAEVTLRSFSVRGKSQLIALPAGNEVLLRLPHERAEFSSYRAQLLFGPETSELATTLVDGDVAVTVTRNSLLDGRYDIELQGVQESGDSEVLGYYSFRK